MSINRRAALIGLGGISTTLTGCGFTNSTRNYKLEFQLTVDGDRRVASVVQQLRTRPYNRFVAGDSSYTEAFGEGAVIDLGAKGRLFSILRFPNFNKYTNQTKYEYSDKMVIEMGLADGGGHATTFFGTRNLSYDKAPGLVAFHDLNDPKSVVAINPENLAAHFGRNVSLDRMVVGFTLSPVTKGEIEKSLPWLRGKQTEQNLDGTLGQTSLLPYALAREIVFPDFKREA